ncbi:hypothetical protein HD554DRAFT_2037556 [Boletus coccyginus]|nr:hypothetical protein HD554DRAFT_2037556 [Boletus coccyginus]
MVRNVNERICPKRPTSRWVYFGDGTGARELPPTLFIKQWRAICTHSVWERAWVDTVLDAEIVTDRESIQRHYSQGQSIADALVFVAPDSERDRMSGGPAKQTRESPGFWILRPAANDPSAPLMGSSQSSLTHGHWSMSFSSTPHMTPRNVDRNNRRRELQHMRREDLIFVLGDPLATTDRQSQITDAGEAKAGRDDEHDPLEARKCICWEKKKATADAIWTSREWAVGMGPARPVFVAGFATNEQRAIPKRHAAAKGGAIEHHLISSGAEAPPKRFN